MMVVAARRVEGGGFQGDVELLCLNCGEDRRFVLESADGVETEMGRRGAPISDARAAALSPELWRMKRCARCGGRVQVIRVDEDGELELRRG